MNQPVQRINDADPDAITIDEATHRIFKSLTPCTDTVTISASDSLGRVVAQNVVSTMDVPPFRASAMDGYALRVADCNHSLTLAGQSLAGHPGADIIPPLSAQRITTGARVPDDANAVVQQENVTRQGDTIIVNQQPHPGLNIRAPGTDTANGATLITAGERIGPAECALLAAHGITQLSVVRKLVVAIFSTGDELVEPGGKRQTGQINDANRALLRAMLTDESIDLVDLGIAADSESALQSVVDASAAADLVVSSGGVSVGDADFVKAVLSKNGSMNIWKIAMKPGRPLTFGFLGPQSAFFGLPGNPVSAALTCLLFVKPAIEHLFGMQQHRQPALTLPLQGSLKKNPGRVEYQRALMLQDDADQWAVTTTGIQDSHVLSSLHKANCLIELPMDSLGAESGDIVRVFPFTHFARSPL